MSRVISDNIDNEDAYLPPPEVRPIQYLNWGVPPLVGFIAFMYISVSSGDPFVMMLGFVAFVIIWALTSAFILLVDLIADRLNNPEEWRNRRPMVRARIRGSITQIRSDVAVSATEVAVEEDKSEPPFYDPNADTFDPLPPPSPRKKGRGGSLYS